MNSMIKAKVIAKTQGFYEVVDKENNSYTVKLKGVLKKTNNKQNCIIGDNVEIDTEKSVITSIDKRKNSLLRPLISNVDYVAFVCSVKNPEFDLLNIYKNLLWVDSNNISSILILNKIDLVEKEELEKLKESISKNLAHIRIFEISVKKDINIEKLEKYMENKVTVLSGISGVGKSSLVNRLIGTNSLSIGDISSRTKKGKNTTIITTYLKNDKIEIYDTPGYSAISIPEYSSKKEIMYSFPEFLEYINLCKFRDCLHIKEPDCAVKKAVVDNLIAKSRYEFYVTLLKD